MLKAEMFLLSICSERPKAPKANTVLSAVAALNVIFIPAVWSANFPADQTVFIFMLLSLHFTFASLDLNISYVSRL